MNILGIETSCDETSAAVVENGHVVRSNIIASSLRLHEKTGGVVPEIAARDSAEKIALVIDRALRESNISWTHIDAIAVTNGPGLAGSLLAGITAAKTLALLYRKPLIPVFHIAGHLWSNILEREENLSFPILSLTVAGGHNDLYLWKSRFVFEKLGETIDDAAGEAFDKGARMLGLRYPGGPNLSRLAESGNPDAVSFPCPMIHEEGYRFSFSGLKTALFYELRKRKSDAGVPDSAKEYLTAREKADIAASFENAIVDTLLSKLFSAADAFKVKAIHLAGGVSANRRLREKVLHETKKRRLDMRYPVKMEYCTDNAAMIAAAGFQMWEKLRENHSSKNPEREFSFRNVRMDLSHDFRF